MSHSAGHRTMGQSLGVRALAFVIAAFLMVIVAAQPAYAVTQNGSQDPSSFGWVRAGNIVPLAVQGHEIYGGVASGTQGLWTGLLTDLIPQIPGGIQDLGGFENRNNVNNPSAVSFHAYGLALDVNASANPNGASPDRSGQFVIPPAAARAAADKWGMEWGGDFNRTPDPMHFEIHLTPADAATLAAANGSPNGTTAGGGGAGGAPAANDQGNAATAASTPCGTGTADTAPTAQTDSNAYSVESVVGGFAVASLCWTLKHIDLGTAPQVADKAKNGWFTTEYAMFRAVALWVMVPVLLMATIQAVAKGKLDGLLKIWLVYLPVSAIGAVVAVGIVQLLLNMTDDFADTFTRSIEADVARFFSGIADGFGVKGISQLIPWFAMCIMGLLLGFACIGVYIILVLREASVYIATAFLPIGFAFFVWPTTANFFKKLAEFLMAMIFSKLLMVAGIALAVAAMASVTGLDGNDGGLTANGGQIATGTTNANGAQGDESWIVWLGQTMTTTVMFGIVMLAPNMMTKLMASTTLGETGRQVGSHSSRPDVMSKAVFADRWAASFRDAKGAIKANGQIKKREELAASTSGVDRALGANGTFRGTSGTYEITHEDMDREHMDAGIQDDVNTLSTSDKARDIDLAHTLYALGDRAVSWKRATPVKGSLGGATIIETRNPSGGPAEKIVLADIADNNNNLIDWTDPAMIRRVTEDLIKGGDNNIRVLIPLSSTVADASSATARFSDPNQHRNAHLVQAQLDKLNAKYGSNAHVIYTAAASVGDAVNQTSSPAGAGQVDF